MQLSGSQNSEFFFGGASWQEEQKSSIDATAFRLADLQERKGGFRAFCMESNSWATFQKNPQTDQI
jgi:hypothetical protein